MRVVDEYRRSLKHREAEEILDLLIYRPAGFLLVKAVYHLPVSPNMLTFLSMLAGLAAAWYFALDATSSWVYASVLYAVANVIDCSDGQLARLQKSGTLLGRVLDGLADYVTSVAVFVGLGVGLAQRGNAQWLLVVASGLSSAVQAGVFDYVQGDFMANAGGVDNFLEKEVERFRNHARTMGGQSGNPMRRWAVNLYLLYLSTQEKLSSRGNYDRKVNDAGSSERRLIRLWSFLGPTTNRTILIVCGLLGTIRLYLWTTTILGNLWLVFCLLLQSRSLQSTKRPAS